MTKHMLQHKHIRICMYVLFYPEEDDDEKVACESIIDKPTKTGILDRLLANHRIIKDNKLLITVRYI